MSRFAYLAKRLLLTPLMLVSASLDEAETEELTRIVEKRIQRAENAVVRDYLAQRGIEGEDAERAAEEFRRVRGEKRPDESDIRRLTDRAEKAEREAARVRVESEARVQMYRLGVPEHNAEDVLLLASKDLERARTEGGDPSLVREAVEAVVARLPGLARAGERQGDTAGSRGNFPRQDDGAAILQQRLEQARASGDNAGAVAIITSAAAKGLTLR